MQTNKNLILWIELLFALLSLWVLLMVPSYPEHVMLVLRIYVLSMIALTGFLVLAVRRYQSQHSSVDMNRIFDMVDRIEEPAFIWASDLSMMYGNPAMNALLNISEDDNGSHALELNRFFHDIGLSPKEAAEAMISRTYATGLQVSPEKKRYINWSTSLMMENNITSLYFSIGFETTKLEEAKQSLSEKSENLAISENRYALSMKLSGVGFLLCETIHNGCYDEYYVSKEAQKFLGIDSDHITFHEFRKKVYPDDRYKFDNYIHDLENPDPTATPTPRVMELRILSEMTKPFVWYAYHYHANLFDKSGIPIVGGALVNISEEKEKDALLEKYAYQDEITEISNRKKLIEYGRECYEAYEKERKPYWVMVLDIDRFHLINDSCGYASGNKVLREFASILSKYQDQGKQDKPGLAARLGADNFALLMHDYEDETLPKHKLELIRKDFAKLESGEFASLSLTCSAGVAHLPRDGKTFEEVLEHAEFALTIGKGDLSYMMGYDAEMHEEILHQGEMQKSLSDAIENHHLQLYYQPKFDLHTEKIMGAEALIRWIKPDGTMISPNVFIPIAEKTGMISDISNFVLREACQQNGLWQKEGLSPIVMSINFASGDFYQANVCEVVQHELDKSGLEPQYLELELTERLALGDINYTINQMNALREMGVLLAMDDFGTGYSSLSYIQRLPLTLLKLDRSFIIEIETDSVAQVIVSAVIQIAKSMNMETIAEGVEYENQSKILKDMGCDYIQGYLYGKPMPAHQFHKRLEINTYGKEVS